VSWSALYVPTPNDTSGRQFPCCYCTLLHDSIGHDPPRSTLAPMTNEERIAGLEHAVMRLSRIVELRSGAYAVDVNAEIQVEGEQIHGWAESMTALRDSP
jgi:hypothetical protein